MIESTHLPQGTIYHKLHKTQQSIESRVQKIFKYPTQTNYYLLSDKLKIPENMTKCYKTCIV